MKEGGEGEEKIAGGAEADMGGVMVVGRAGGAEGRPDREGAGEVIGYRGRILGEEEVLEEMDRVEGG